MQYILGVDTETLFRDGGVFVWLILLAGIVAVGIALERAFVLFFRANVNAPAFMAQIQKHVLAGDVDRAIRLCNAEPQAAVPRVVKAALTHVNQPEAEVVSAVDEAVLDVSPIVNRRISYLPMLANVATLMGLLGTIAGLILAFDAVAHAIPEEKQLKLAEGISKAMYTTGAGLIVAVPTLVVHSMLLSRANKILDDVDQFSVRAINLIMARRRAGSRPAEVAGGSGPGH